MRLRVEPLDLPRHLAHAPDAVGDGPHHVLPVAAVQVPPTPAQHRQKGTLHAVTVVRGKSVPTDWQKRVLTMCMMRNEIINQNEGTCDLTARVPCKLRPSTFERSPFVSTTRVIS